MSRCNVCSEKAYVNPCAHCDKKFSQASHLSSHERTHTNEKPFECEQCDKKFTQSSTLRRHQMTHTDDKP